VSLANPLVETDDEWLSHIRHRRLSTIPHEHVMPFVRASATAQLLLLLRSRMQ
jgi:hypothetical protein